MVISLLMTQKSVTILLMVLHTQIARLLLLCCALMITACKPPADAQMPALDLTTIKGDNIQTKTLTNKVILVSFWATSCKSCVEEMPELIKTYEKYHGKGLEVLAVSMPYDPPAQLMAFANQKSLPFPVIHDSYGDITAQFGDIHATPTAYLYNKAGKRIKKTVGTLNFDKLHTLLNQELS